MARSYSGRPFIGVGAVILRSERVLLVQRGNPPRQGEWSLPGGLQRLGESVEVAIRREIAEETGLRVVPLGIVDVVDMIDRDDAGEIRHHYTLIDFWAESPSGDAVAGDDAAAVIWAGLDDLAAYGLWRETERIIRGAVTLREKKSRDER
ncbi:MAG: NUDIX hydrolase [Alphaproteobacteria bacterium]|nr:NUDIX hydrolase [Alphaproteobacteria bacterium]